MKLVLLAAGAAALAPGPSAARRRTPLAAAQRDVPSMDDILRKRQRGRTGRARAVAPRAVAVASRGAAAALEPA